MSLAASVRSAVSDDGTTGNKKRKEIFKKLGLRIEEMIKDLEQQALDDDAQYAQCTGKLAKIQKDRKAAYKKVKETTAANLETMATITKLETKHKEENNQARETKENASEQKTTLTNLKGRAAHERAEHEKTKNVLVGVKAAMEQFTKEENKEALMKDNEAADYQKSSSSDTIMAFLQQLTATAEQGIEEMKATEQQASSDIEALETACVASIKDLRDQQAEDVNELKALDDAFMTTGNEQRTAMSEYLTGTREYITLKYEDPECAETQLSKDELIKKQEGAIEILTETLEMLNSFDLDDANTRDVNDA